MPGRDNSPAKSFETEKSGPTAFLKKNTCTIPPALQIVSWVVIVIAHPLDEDMRNLETGCRFNNCADSTTVSWTCQVARNRPRISRAPCIVVSTRVGRLAFSCDMLERIFSEDPGFFSCGLDSSPSLANSTRWM